MFKVKLGKRMLTVYYICRSGKKLPFIGLGGKWLQDQGFETGSKIEVKGRQGILLIRLVPQAP